MIYRFALLLIFLHLFIAYGASAQDSSSVASPEEYVYRTFKNVKLKAYVFKPAAAKPDARRAAIVIFHGGGWYMGEPQWAFSRAQHFAELGMVAVAAQYRLSGSKTGFTPLEAMEDAREVIRWMRAKADVLGISPRRIAGYGWSAGAHLAVWAALAETSGKPDKSCCPDALILFSPAVSVVEDRWMRQILGNRATPEDLSPDLHVRKRMPPTIILQGRTDTVTKLSGTQRFHEAMLAAGNRSELHVYDGVGHLFTPSTESDRGWPNPDKKVQAAAYREADLFLESLGFIK